MEVTFSLRIVACSHSVAQVQNWCIVGRVTMNFLTSDAGLLGSVGQMTTFDADGWYPSDAYGRMLLLCLRHCSFTTLAPLRL